ncbi:MAG: hypothetical protein Q7J38_06130 [Gallionella sp.]|nr:hypothetical protein [Gallionella sp.]
MSSVAFITSTQQAISAMSGLSAAQQTATSSQSQPTANASSIAANSTTVSISQQAQTLAATSQASSSSSGSYDFTNMTPNQMRDVAQDLFNSGKISSQQNLMLLTTSFVGRFPATKEYTPPTDAEIAHHNNTPMNYVQCSKDRISYLESAGLTSDPQYGYESWKGLLAFMQNTTSSSAA